MLDVLPIVEEKTRHSILLECPFTVSGKQEVESTQAENRHRIGTKRDELLTANTEHCWNRVHSKQNIG